MWQLLTQSAWADRIGWVLIHSLWQFTLVAIGAIVLRQALQRCSAATRYGALLTVMIIMVAMPVGTWFSTWLVPAPAAAVKLAPVENVEHGSPLQPLDDTMPMAARPAASPMELAAEPQPEPERVEPVPTGPASSWSLVKSRVEPWLPEIVLAWFAGVLVAAFRPLWSWHTVRRLRRVGISPVGDAVHGVLARTARKLGLARTVEAWQSTLVKTPVVLGCFRPLVLLPLCVVSGLPAAQLEMILAHELAHIRRHDYLVNLLQTLVETLFFYHPAVWWLSRQIRNERENCCDDVAIALAGSRAEYGRALLAIEELRAASPALSLAAGGGSLLARIRRIAGRESAPRVVGGGSILGVILVSMALFAVATWGAARTAETPGGKDQSDKTSAAKPADKVSSASDQSATKEVSKIESKPIATIDQISAAWRTRQKRVRSARIEWKETELIPAGTKPPLRMFSGKQKSATGTKLEMLPLTDISVECSRTVLLNGRMLRMNRQGSHWHSFRGDVEQDTYVSTFDGGVAKSFFDDTASIGELIGFILKEARNHDFNNRNYLPIALAFRPCDIDMGGRDLAKYTVSQGIETIDGRACVVITGKPPYSSYETLWLDPQRDFLVVRVRYESGNSTTFDISYQKDSSFGWVPSEWKWISRSGNTGRFFGQAIVKVTTCTINTDIPRSAFQFEFPVGTYVSDLRMEDTETNSYIACSADLECNIFEFPGGARRFDGSARRRPGVGFGL